MKNYYITGYKRINYTSQDGKIIQGIKIYVMSELFSDDKGLAFSELFISSHNSLYNTILKLDFSNNIYKCNLDFSYSNQKIKLKEITNITELPLII